MDSSLLLHISGVFWEISIHIFVLKSNIHVKIGNFKPGDSLTNQEGFLAKAGKRNPADGLGTPSNIKSNLKYNSELIGVFKIYSINLLLFSTLKNWLFFSTITFF